MTTEDFVIDETLPSPLFLQVHWGLMDLCDEPDTKGCFTFPGELQFLAAVEIFICAADASGDLVVDEDDLSAVLEDWDTDGSANGGDVNGDGIVDVNDIVDDIVGWGSCY